MAHENGSESNGCRRYRAFLEAMQTYVCSLNPVDTPSRKMAGAFCSRISLELDQRYLYILSEHPRSLSSVTALLLHAQLLTLDEQCTHQPMDITSLDNFLASQGFNYISSDIAQQAQEVYLFHTGFEHAYHSVVPETPLSLRKHALYALSQYLKTQQLVLPPETEALLDILPHSRSVITSQRSAGTHAHEQQPPEGLSFPWRLLANIKPYVNWMNPF
ncbi:hypothetical protein HZB02_05595 [Candidatus Woesearchaeota archaeon]|nr:hypothetical protein [Candidatus Woesearchaeota archaeon]